MSVDIDDVIQRIRAAKSLMHGDGMQQDEADELLTECINDLSTLVDDGK